MATGAESSLARDRWLMQDSRTCESNGRLLNDLDMNANVVGLVTDCTGELKPLRRGVKEYPCAR